MKTRGKLVYYCNRGSLSNLCCGRARDQQLHESPPFFTLCFVVHVPLQISPQ